MNIPENVLEKIHQIIEDGDYEFADNFRAARYTHPEEMTEYERRQNRGCCGFYDGECMIDGEVWQIGFNYGH